MQVKSDRRLRREPSGAACTADPGQLSRYAAWFHELDAWTEYWDIFHAETEGRYFFGNGRDQEGLLSAFMPRHSWPAPFTAWVSVALGSAPPSSFAETVRVPAVAHAVVEVEQLVSRLFARHFGDPADDETRYHYLEAMHRFATDTLPPATQRYDLIPEGDHRRRTAGRHTLDGDVMWFAWALHLEATHLLAPAGDSTANKRRALMMAAVATGCAANFAWRGHRRTRPEYRADDDTAQHLRELGLSWADNFDAARAEVHALYRIREWGHD
jgi:hypothetical protein